jgi:hypothetical protein
MLRMQLFRMRPFVYGCPARTTLLNLLEHRKYYIEGTDLWSLHDFQRVCAVALCVWQHARLLGGEKSVAVAGGTGLLCALLQAQPPVGCSHNPPLTGLLLFASFPAAD